MIVDARTIYIDALLLSALLCFVMDFLLLWATAKVSGMLRPATKIAAGSAFGTAYFVLYTLAPTGLLPQAASIRSWPVIGIVSIAMLYIALAPLAPRQLLRAGAFYYFIAVSAGGAGLAVAYTLKWAVPLQLIAAAVAIIVISETGWGVVQRSLWQRLYHLPLEMTIFGQTRQTTALLDTGNRLRDPLSGGNVIIAEIAVFGDAIPDVIKHAIQRMSAGDFSTVTELLASEKWSSRFRVIPFRSLGRDHGMLVGFRPDATTVIFDGERIDLPSVTVGLYHRPLDTRGTYHALLHPEVLTSLPGGTPSPTPSSTDATYGRLGPSPTR